MTKERLETILDEIHLCSVRIQEIDAQATEIVGGVKALKDDETQSDKIRSLLVQLKLTEAEKLSVSDKYYSLTKIAKEYAHFQNELDEEKKNFFALVLSQNQENLFEVVDGKVTLNPNKTEDWEKIKEGVTAMFTNVDLKMVLNQPLFQN